MAEHVMGGLLVLSRRFDRTLDAQRERRWIQNELSDDWPWLLHGQSMTIVGLGTIGLEVAKRAHAFGMRVTGVRRRADQPRPDVRRSRRRARSVDEALSGMRRARPLGARRVGDAADDRRARSWRCSIAARCS